uniref:Uncharacterized protein n=1 Tax=Fagus sylvatica TaxID=28930 RepID=A0A2N9H6T9_FAGSY
MPTSSNQLTHDFRLMGSIMGSIGIGFDWMGDLGVVHGGFVVE